jgi:Domain of unknown function (DUF4159)
MTLTKKPAAWFQMTLCAFALATYSLPYVMAESDNADTDRTEARADDGGEASTVYSAKLIYADDKTAICFSDQFLAVTAEETNIQAHPSFDEVRLDSAELFDYPFAVMSGEGTFTLPEDQLKNMQDYLMGGGFLVASAGCSSRPWNESFKKMMAEAFPDMQMTKLDAEHPVFHSVYDITQSRYKSGGPRLPHIEALQIDGRVVMIWSPDGLNDTGNAGGECCCCGGNEIASAKKLNVNILAYALTH